MPASYLLMACAVIFGLVRSASERMESPARLRASRSRCPNMLDHYICQLEVDILVIIIDIVNLRRSPMRRCLYGVLGKVRGVRYGKG